MRMIEVESKVRVNDVRQVRKKIRALARLKKKVMKIDDYYTLEDARKYPKKSLRIRKNGKVYEINFKKRINYRGGVHAKKETEFRVSDIAGFLELIKDFGFKKWIRKEKYSEIYEIEPRFHIELNRVKKLGWFLEIEYLANPSEIEMARRRVEKVMSALGIKRKEIVKEGYTKLLWNLEHGKRVKEEGRARALGRAGGK
ncbi:class IV adenylate cyclase [Candidatus Pacearchaeota archaeon]|nr:MAG: class IV adenylate cyclase [Candidatus Pacearchaeota archaeon]